MRPGQSNLQDTIITPESSIESEDESQLQSDMSSHINDESILLLSDDEEIEVSELSEEERSRTSSASSAGTTANPMLNNLILLSITSEKVDGKIKIMFSKERANTVLGEKQGDHVTSHRLFVELLNNKLKDAKISEIPTIILSTMEEIIPDFSNTESLLNIEEKDLKKTKFPSQILAADARQDLVNLVKENFELGNRQKRVTKLNTFLSSVIQTYNALDDVTYVRRTGEQGEKGKNEGTLTHQSVCTLQAIDEFLKIEKILDPAEKQKQHQGLFCKLLAKNGEYCHGAMLLFNKSKIEEVRQEFCIPREGLDSDEIKKRLDPDAKIRQGTKIPDFNEFYEAIKEKSLDTSTIAELFNNCFDFQHYDTNTENLRKAKTKHEVRRDEDKSNPEKLYDLAARHIIMIFKTFPELEATNVDELVANFAEFLYENQKWKDCQTESGQISSNEIYEEIKNRADLVHLKIRRDFLPQIEFQDLGIS
jgi:hypothetical protein